MVSCSLSQVSQRKRETFFEDAAFTLVRLVPTHSGQFVLHQNTQATNWLNRLLFDQHFALTELADMDAHTPLTILLFLLLLS